MASKNVSIRLALKGGPDVERQFKRLGDEGARALGRVHAGVTPASRGLKALNAVTGELRMGMTGTAAQLGAVGSGLVALGPVGLAAAAGIGAAVLALRGMSARAHAAIQELDKLGDTADKLGVSAEGLQELRYAFEQNGVTVQTLEMGLQRLGRRIGEIANFGKGEAKNALDELGVSIYDTTDRLKTIEDILPEIADALSRVSDQNRRLSLTQKLVDSEGVGMVTMLQQGSAALEEYRQEARDLGVVVGETFVRKASESADKLQTLNAIIDTKLNQALVDLAPVLLAAVEGFAYMAAAVGDLVDSFRDLEGMSATGLKRELSGLGEDLDKLYAQHEAAKAALERPGVNKAIVQTELQSLQDAIDAKLGEVKKVQDQLNNRAASRAPRAAPDGSGLTGNSQTKKDPFGDYITDLNKKIAAQDTEINVLNQTAGAQARARAELQLHNILTKENITLTASQTNALQVSLSDLESATNRFSELSDAQRISAQRAQSFGDAWVRMSKSIIFQTDSMSDAVRGFAMEIANIAISNAFLEPAGKAAGSFLASMLPFEDGGVMTARGPVPLRAYDKGGIAYGPQLALYGEGKQPEAYVPLPDGRTIPVTLNGMGGSAPKINFHIHNNAPGVRARIGEPRNENGELRTDVIIEEMEGNMARHISRGEGLASVLETRYGLMPVGG